MNQALPITPIIKHEFTEDLNREELYYRDVIQPSEDDYREVQRWLVVSVENSDVLPELYTFIEFKGEILELGAGSCWFSSNLSLLGLVNRIYCLDISQHLLERVAPHVMKHLEARIEKLIRVIGDFNRLYFQDMQFDFVVCDATLHHIQESSFSKVLGEVYRVLKADGKVVAINEPFLSRNAGFNKHRRGRFGAHEREYGVTENIYTKEEWRGIFEGAGFKCHFIPCEFIKADKPELRKG
jgi:SAM-dependent methyltransferase